MTKMKRKYTKMTRFCGTVDSSPLLVLFAEGKTKREAVKKLRKAFSKIGVHTQPDPMTDLLVCGLARTHQQDPNPCVDTRILNRA